MSKDKLTKEQAERLTPYEKHFGTAIRSGYCSYPGEAAIENMRNVWAELTGQTYPMRAGCSVCIFNLVRDLGVLWYAAAGKDPFAVVKATQKAKAAPKTAKTNKPALKKSTAPKAPKTAKK